MLSCASACTDLAHFCAHLALPLRLRTQHLDQVQKMKHEPTTSLLQDQRASTELVSTMFLLQTWNALPLSRAHIFHFCCKLSRCYLAAARARPHKLHQLKGLANFIAPCALRSPIVQDQASRKATTCVLLLLEATFLTAHALCFSKKTCRKHFLLAILAI